MSKYASISFHDVKSITLVGTGKLDSGSAYGKLVIVDSYGVEDSVDLFWHPDTVTTFDSALTAEFYPQPVAAQPPALEPDQVDELLARPQNIAEPTEHRSGKERRDKRNQIELFTADRRVADVPRRFMDEEPF